MSKQSIFRKFVAAIKQHWRSTSPQVHALDTTYCPAMPKASTFYAGIAPGPSLHVFINLQASPYAWAVGRVTVNVILSKKLGRPDRWARGEIPADWSKIGEGSYRLGRLLWNKDKWWHLDEPGSNSGIAWYATRYDDPSHVIAEAVADVSRDIEDVLQRLEMSKAPLAGST